MPSAIKSKLIEESRKVLLALSLDAAVTAGMLALVHGTDVRHDSVVYLMPVIVAAIRWGIVAALAAAVGGLGASAFFFYPPIFDFRVDNPDQALDLIMFVFVAIVTSQLASQLSKAKTYAETEVLRQALIDSVSHELRTPLVSILGAATVLHDAPAVASNAQLRDLAKVVREEAERLNSDIQNLLDATRIGSKGIQPLLEWADPSDIVNSAVERCRTRLANHDVKLDLPQDVPLVHIDAMLVQQALVQILDNARKYSPPHSEISVGLRSDPDSVRISVQDAGAGLTGDESVHLWDRFFRSERLSSIATGSGLGLWIASSFVAANGGTLTALSQGIDRGTLITIDLPRSAGPMINGGRVEDDRDG